MRGSHKLESVKRTTPSMSKALPDMPMDHVVLVRLIRILASTMSHYFEPVFRRAGLTENSFHVLCLLVSTKEGIATPSELTEMIGTSKPNMSRIINQLNTHNLIERYVEPMDTRRHILQITEKGRNVANQTVPMLIEPLSAAFSGLTAEEQKLFNALLQKAISSLDEADKSWG